MKLFQVEYILAVCEHGSISKAADAILVSRPAVSRAVKYVEEEYGISLFRRSTAGVELTEAGRLLYERCLQLKKILTDLDSDMRVLRGEISEQQARTVSLGLSYTARCCVLPFLAAFRRRWPDVQLLLTDVSRSYLDTGELGGDYDLEITLSGREQPEGLASLDLGSSRFVFCCPKGHPLAGRASVSVRDVGQEPLGSLTGLDPKNNHLVRLFTEQGLKPNLAYMTGQVSALRQMIRQGLCCSIQPLQSLEGDPDIAAVPMEGMEPLRLRLIWDGQLLQNSACRDLIRFAEEYFKEHPVEG